jgi:hypothetical protein
VRFQSDWRLALGRLPEAVTAARLHGAACSLECHPASGLQPVAAVWLHMALWQCHSVTGTGFLADAYGCYTASYDSGSQHLLWLLLGCKWQLLVAWLLRMLHAVCYCQSFGLRELRFGIAVCSCPYRYCSTGIFGVSVQIRML